MDRTRITRGLGVSAVALFLIVGAALGADAITRPAPAGSFEPTLSNQVEHGLETAEPSETPEATETPEPSETPEATETPEPSETPEATETPAATGEDGEDHGGSSGEHGSNGD